MLLVNFTFDALTRIVDRGIGLLSDSMFRIPSSISRKRTEFTQTQRTWFSKSSSSGSDLAAGRQNERHSKNWGILLNVLEITMGGGVCLNSVANRVRQPEMQQQIELTTDFPDENRREFVAKLG
jgi:hypothetical protein